MITWAFAEGIDAERLGYLVADRIWPGQGKEFGNCRALVVMNGDELAAGMIYHNYDPAAAVVEISGAAWFKGWMTRGVLRAMYSYPFNDCGCQAVVQRVPDEDKAQHRMLKAYGFERYRIPRLRGRDKAENVYILTDDAWRASSFNRKHEVN